MHGLLGPPAEGRNGQIGGWTAQPHDTKLVTGVTDGTGDALDALRALRGGLVGWP